MRALPPLEFAAAEGQHGMEWHARGQRVVQRRNFVQSQKQALLLNYAVDLGRLEFSKNLLGVEMYVLGEQ